MLMLWYCTRCNVADRRFVRVLFSAFVHFQIVCGNKYKKCTMKEIPIRWPLAVAPVFRYVSCNQWPVVVVLLQSFAFRCIGRLCGEQEPYAPLRPSEKHSAFFVCTDRRYFRYFPPNRLFPLHALLVAESMAQNGAKQKLHVCTYKLIRIGRPTLIAFCPSLIYIYMFIFSLYSFPSLWRIMGKRSNSIKIFSWNIFAFRVPESRCCLLIWQQKKEEKNMFGAYFTRFGWCNKTSQRCCRQLREFGVTELSFTSSMPWARCARWDLAATHNLQCACL